MAAHDSPPVATASSAIWDTARFSPYEQQVYNIFTKQLPAQLGFALRENQLQMAMATAHALEHQELLVVEAGTGVGKSLAYLIPAVIWQGLHPGKPIVISTKTLNLQQQIFDLDIPRLHDQLGLEFRAIQARGRSNYLCQRKLARLAHHPKLEDAQQATVSRLWSQVKRTIHQGPQHSLFPDLTVTDIDIDSAPINGIRSDFDIKDSRLWQQLTCDTLSCSRQHCRFFSSCYLYRERQLLAQADIIVTNHSMLFSSLGVLEKGGNPIIPSLENVVLDEAHHLEDTATSHLGHRFAYSDFFAFFRQIYTYHESNETGELSLLRDNLMLLGLQQEANALETAIFGQLCQLGEDAESFFQSLKEYAKSIDKDSTAVFSLPETLFSSISQQVERLTHQGLKGLSPRLRQHLSRQKAQMTQDDILQGLFSFDQEDNDSSLGLVSEEEYSLAELDDSTPLAQLKLEYQAASLLVDFEQCSSVLKGIIDKLRDISADSSAPLIPPTQYLAQGIYDALLQQREELQLCTHRQAQGWIYWANAGTNPTLCADPLEVAPILAQLFYAKLKSGIFASATLTTEGKCDFFLKRVGLSLVPSRLGTPLIVGSPFDYPRRVLLGIPTDTPQATSGRNSQYFWQSIGKDIAQLVCQIRGRTLILATSWEDLNAAYRVLSPLMQLAGIRALRQESGAGNRAQLLKTFRTQQPCLLIGTDSFWEGVDVPGPALSCVIISKLPFKSPSDPVFSARCRELPDSFNQYSKPLAITKLRQGFGRLMRTVEDRGCVMLLDRRILERSYGRSFLSSLPRCQRQVEPLKDLIKDCRQWILHSSL